MDKIALERIRARAEGAVVWRSIANCVRRLCLYIGDLEYRLEILEQSKDANSVVQNVDTIEEGASLTGITL